jgi:hypothetical protein
VDLNTILLLLALVLALPGGLFIGYIMSVPRARWLALLGGIVGDVAIAAAIYAYITLVKPGLDPLSFFLGSFFGCTTGVAIGALLANFVVGLFSRGPDVTSMEY